MLVIKLNMYVNFLKKSNEVKKILAWKNSFVKILQYKKAYKSIEMMLCMIDTKKV